MLFFCAWGALWQVTRGGRGICFRSRPAVLLMAPSVCPASVACEAPVPSPARHGHLSPELLLLVEVSLAPVPLLRALGASAKWETSPFSARRPSGPHWTRQGRGFGVGGGCWPVAACMYRRQGAGRDAQQPWLMAWSPLSESTAPVLGQGLRDTQSRGPVGDACLLSPALAMGSFLEVLGGQEAKLRARAYMGLWQWKEAGGVVLQPTCLASGRPHHRVGLPADGW